MELIDTHAHLTADGIFERLDDVLAAAQNSGVRHVIAVASDVPDARTALGIASRHAMVSCTAGIHPHEAAKATDACVGELADLFAEREVVAVGEIGLDYYYDFSDRQTQMRVLAMQLEVAQGVDLPLVVHCRDAFEDVVTMLERYGFCGKPVVFHCFTGTVKEAQWIAERGWRLSFTGIVTFRKSAALLPVARDYPADELMLETDSPYLSPEPVRHVRPNEPSHVAHTASFLAQLRGVAPDQLGRETSTNARRFFRLPT